MLIKIKILNNTNMYIRMVQPLYGSTTDPVQRFLLCIRECGNIAYLLRTYYNIGKTSKISKIKMR